MNNKYSELKEEFDYLAARYRLSQTCSFEWRGKYDELKEEHAELQKKHAELLCDNAKLAKKHAFLQEKYSCQHEKYVELVYKYNELIAEKLEYARSKFAETNFEPVGIRCNCYIPRCCIRCKKEQDDD